MDARNGFKTCVLSEWLTTLCALRMALTEWDGPVLCKHVVWRQRKMLKLIKQILSCSRNKNLFDSISEGAWELPRYLFLIFCWFHVNNGDITMVVGHACERAWSIYSNGSETGPDESLVRIGYFKTWMIQYEFKDIFSYGVWHTNRALTKWNMKLPKSKSEWGLQYF